MGMVSNYSNILVFVCLFVLYYLTVVECGFPKCEDILKNDNGKNMCWKCSTQRIGEACKDQCQTLGCAGNITTSAITSVSGTTTATPKGSDNKTNSAVNDVATEDDQSDKKKKAKGKEKQNKKKKGGKSKTKDSESTDSKSKTNKNSNVSKKPNNDVKCDGIEPCVPLEDATAKFKQCCKEKGIQRSCWDKCRYDVGKTELQDAFTKNRCALSESREYLYCAANNQDNTQCCQKTHVLDEERSICVPFCNPYSDQWPEKAEIKYYRCLSQFDQIMKCHWAGRKP